MTLHRTLDEEALGTAALHALGALPLEEARDYEAHLEVCPLCRVEVLTLRDLVSELPLAALPADPPASLRQRVLARARGSQTEARTGVDADPLQTSAARSPVSRKSTAPQEDGRPVQTWKAWTPAAGEGEFAFAMSKDGVWEQTGVEGIEARRLFVDVANDRATMLIRMAPGTAYPRHRHASAEECYVIEGDLRVGEARLKAGDYHRAGLGSTHGIQSTQNGCLLLIVSSLHDEILLQGP